MILSYERFVKAGSIYVPNDDLITTATALTNKVEELFEKQESIEREEQKRPRHLRIVK